MGVWSRWQSHDAKDTAQSGDLYRDEMVLLFGEGKISGLLNNSKRPRMAVCRDNEPFPFELTRLCCGSVGFGTAIVLNDSIRQAAS